MRFLENKIRLQKASEIILNIAFWLVSAWLIISAFSVQFQEIEIIGGKETVTFVRNQNLVIHLSVCVGICFFMFYINLWNIKRLNISIQKVKIILYSLLIFIASVFCFFLFEELNKQGKELILSLPISFSIGIMFFYFTISLSYGFGSVWLLAEKKQKKWEVSKKQAELNLLRNQLQPHFLFNALNNLLSMVDQQKSPQLAISFEKLSRLLRYVIEESKSEKVTLAAEIEFIRNYVSLQLLRFEEDEIDFCCTIKGNFTNQLVEVGIFIPFVENAFKYGTAPEQKSKIELCFDIRKATEIYFTIQNPIVDHRISQSTGSGIASTEERLNLVYPQKHSLTIEEKKEKNLFCVDLKISTN